MRRDVGEDDPEIARLAEVRRLAAGYRAAAVRAAAFARRYRTEEGAPGGERERACLAQIREWREAVRELRAGLRGPGLARARAEVADEGAKTG